MPADLELHAAMRWQLVRRNEVSAELVAEVAALYDRSFGGWPQSSLRHVPAIDHLSWKMADPHTDLALFGGRLDGRLVHAATLRAANLRLRGEKVRQVRFVDTSVDPEFRGRGLAGAAMGHLREHHLLPRALRIGEPQHGAIRGWYGGRNRPLGNRVFLHARILDAGRCLSHLGSVVDSVPARLLSRVALRLASLWGRLRALGGRSSAGFDIEDAAHFDSGVEPLLEEAVADFDLLHERNAAYLDWRYCDRRGGDFSVRAVRQGGRWLGYAVTCVRGDLGYLADILLQPGRPELADALVRDSVDRLERAGVAGVACWLPKRHPYRSSLKRQGLLAVRDVGISYRSEDWPAEKLRFLEALDVRVHYTIGDTDLV
jgi:GNAT superfamily N-acetyltransferase